MDQFPPLHSTLNIHYNSSSGELMTTIVFIRPKIKIPEPMPYPPHGIGYMASILRKYGHKVYFIDCAILKNTYPEIIRQIQALKPDVIGITAVSAYYLEMKKLARLLHTTKIPIILGGVHVTTLPELSLRECNADFAVLGEGELTILELMNTWADKEKRKTIKGIAYIENNQFVMNPQRELIQNLDDLPFPAWDLIDPLKYPIKYSYFKVKRYPVAAIFTSRGCPHYCIYCATCAFWRHQFRRRSPQNVVDEMEYLIDEFGVREIQIGDDYFNCDKKHVIGICREILRRKLKVSISCPSGVRIENLDKDLLTLMKKAGFYALTIAIESGTQSILNNANKKLNLNKVFKMVNLAKSSGFFLLGYFIFGLPGETFETARRTIELAKKLPFDIIAFFIAKPLPGSSWFEKWVQNKELDGFNYDWFCFLENESKLKFSKGKWTIRIPTDAYREFYFRPKQFVRYLKYWVHTFHFNQSFITPLQRVYKQILNTLNKK